MARVNISTDYLVDLLMERLTSYWEADEIEQELYRKMYTDYAEDGVFDGDREFDPMIIVDNDWVNWCSVIYKGDELFDRLLELYNNGDRDVSCEENLDGIDYVEAVNDDKSAILVRRC
jgi:hypothetical protein